MPLLEVLALFVILTVETTWLLASLATSQRLGSTGPLWLCWPSRFWDAIYGRPAAHRPRADQAKIQRLERELGIGQNAEPPRPERGLRSDPVCLIKGCDGGTELRLWSGMLIRRVHDHD